MYARLAASWLWPSYRTQGVPLVRVFSTRSTSPQLSSTTDPLPPPRHSTRPPYLPFFLTSLPALHKPTYTQLAMNRIHRYPTKPNVDLHHRETACQVRSIKLWHSKPMPPERAGCIASPKHSALPCALPLGGVSASTPSLHTLHLLCCPRALLSRAFSRAAELGELRSYQRLTAVTSRLNTYSDVRVVASSPVCTQSP